MPIFILHLFKKIFSTYLCQNKERKVIFDFYALKAHWSCLGRWCISQLGLPLTKHHKICHLNNKKLMSYFSRGWEAQDQGPVKSVSGASSFLWLQMAAYLLCLHMALPLHRRVKRKVLPLYSSSEKANSMIGLGSHLYKLL